MKANTELQVKYDEGLITIALNEKIDALAALAAVEQSGLDWGNIQTRQDSLEDVFVKMVSGTVDDQGNVLVKDKEEMN